MKGKRPAGVHMHLSTDVTIGLLRLRGFLKHHVKNKPDIKNKEQIFLEVRD